ncbi:MAG: alpha/beta hydrolase [Rhodococcus sp. (in: high G+C Gram-positive bacteria)]|jgi:esterase|uniref:alpha/beta fold hydrolase n=1 Tax=Rhodococcus sp. EPR-157 TaxID=1813677 RepID=UPI0007BB41DD|nr:alpha/beta hydrolase [Rhodococcus sp. EPR-157]KZE99557.1 hydrolase [Rhodococcus sp. EPR-157]
MSVEVAELDVDGVRIAFRDTGGVDSRRDFCPVVLVHGMGGDSGTWDRFASALTAAGRRVVAIDLRGHGRSAHTTDYSFDAFGRDVAAVLDHLKLTAVDLVGHSLGGYAVTVVAQDRPSIVRSLVIEEMPIPIKDGDETPTFARRLPSPGELWHAATSVIRHPRAVFAYDRSMTSPAIAQFRRPNAVWWGRLSEIRASTLVLRGGPGGMVDPGRLDSMVAAIDECSVVSFDTGHSIHRDKYSDFEAVVLPFLMRDS